MVVYKRKKPVRYNKRINENILKAKGVGSVLSAKDQTTKAELYRIWDQIREEGMPDLLVEWDYKYNPAMYDKPVVINLGNPLQMGGTHWISIWQNKYFDSFGLPPSDIVLKNGFKGAWNDVQIQDMREGGCGQYALLWLYYVMDGREKEFYDLFRV